MSPAPASAPVTWTLSGFGDEIDPDPVVQFAVLQALGAQHVEVRGAWDTNIVELTGEQLDRFAGLLSQWGMGVSAIASPVGKVSVTEDPEGELIRLGRAAAWVRAAAWSADRNNALASGRKTSPASVSRLPCGVRSSRREPSCCSRRRT